MERGGVGVTQCLPLYPPSASSAVKCMCGEWRQPRCPRRDRKKFSRKCRQFAVNILQPPWSDWQGRPRVSFEFAIVQCSVTSPREYPSPRMTDQERVSSCGMALLLGKGCDDRRRSKPPEMPFLDSPKAENLQSKSRGEYKKRTRLHLQAARGS